MEGDDDVPVVFGWAPEDAQALATCGDERLDALVYELIADEDESEEDEVEVEGEVWASVRQSLRAVRALARKAGKTGAHLCLYFAMHPLRRGGLPTRLRAPPPLRGRGQSRRRT